MDSFSGSASVWAPHSFDNVDNLFLTKNHQWKPFQGFQMLDFFGSLVNASEAMGTA